MPRKTIKIITALLLCMQSAVAQTAFHSLEDVWRYADEHNVTIRNAALEAEKAHAVKTQSYLAFTPQVGANAAFTNNTSLQTTLIPAVIFGGAADVYTPVQFGQKYIYNAGFTAQLDLVNVQTWMNVRMARDAEGQSKAALGNTKRNTYQQIATQYYTYLLNKEAQRLTALSAAVADSVYQSVSNKYKEGTLNQGNADVAQLNSERAQQTYITAAYQARMAANSLKALLGMAMSDSMSIDATIERNATPAVVSNFNEDPAVTLAGYQTRVNLSTLKAANASYYPTLSVLYSNVTQQNDNEFRPLQNGPAWYPARYWSLRASWTIFNGGSRWLQSQKSRINYRESQLQYEQAKRQADINDENLRLAYEKAELYRTKALHIMELSYDNYRHVTYRYESGLGSLDDRLNAFTDYINYQNQYLNSLSDLLVQQYQMKIRQQTF